MSSAPKSVTDILWARGELSYKLRKGQLGPYNFVRSQRQRHLVCNLHRGLGKSYLATLINVEDCLRGRVNCFYFSPTQKLSRAIVLPLLRNILEDCPRSLRPKLDAQNGCYRFPSTGAVLWLFGADTGIDAARGQDIHRATLDEEGFFRGGADYLVSSVLMPRILPIPDASILHMSTPPLSPSHPYGRRIKDARANGYLFELSVDKNPEITPELLEEYAREAGGRHTTAFRREYGVGARIARAIGVSRQSVNQWSYVPDQYVGDVMRVARLPLDRVRPDLAAKQGRTTGPLDSVAA